MATRRKLLTLAAATPAAALPRRAAAQAERHLRIGLAGAVTSLDPHALLLTPNQAVAAHFFDTLVGRDEAQRPVPKLATSWRAVDDLTWEFALRPGVTFHDGSPCEAEDVVATLDRVNNYPSGPALFRSNIRGVVGVQAVDAMTLRVSSAAPDPTIPINLSSIAVISRRFRSAPAAAFNGGEALIGTGPFRPAGFVPGDRIAMRRNDAYWDGASPWSGVTSRLVSDNAARVAGLLTGELDVIENLSPENFDRIRATPGLSIAGVDSGRVMFVTLDQGRDQSPDITDADGRPLAGNPLADARVRRAMSLAIDREALVSRIMGGEGSPAGQLVAEQFLGASPNLPAEKPDPARARALLAEAGYPRGFGLTLYGPRDRYRNDASLVQAVAQMFTRIGIRTRAEVLPWLRLNPAAIARQYSAVLFGWATNTGEAGAMLGPLLESHDAGIGRGVRNDGRYANPAFDALLQRAAATIDRDRRGALLAEAAELAAPDCPILPLLFLRTSWGVRDSIVFSGRADEFTLAMSARPRG